MRALVLIKPSSRDDAAVDTALEQLSAFGVTVMNPRSERLADWPMLIETYAARTDCVVVGGGDGSLNLVLDSVMRHGLALGVLPLGTANDFARTLGYPDDAIGACRIIAEGVDHNVDVGQVNNVYFLNVASIGLAARAHRYRSEKAKRWFGTLGYARNAYAAFRDTRPFRAWVSCEGQRRELHSMQLAVGNGRYFGGGLAVSEDSALDDGKLDLFSLEPQSLGALLRLLPALRRGPDTSTRRGHLMQGQWFDIDTARRRSINTDGEVLTYTPATFRVLPQALTVRVPAAYREDALTHHQDSGETA